MSSSILVSILIPTYNAESFLADSLASILSQTFCGAEIIVVDNCSTDGTVAIAKRFLNEGHMFQIVVNEVNLGGEGNFNKCLSIARGKYVAIYHADDVYTPNIVSKCVQLLELNHSIGAVSTLGEIIDESGAASGHFFKLPQALKGRGRYGFTFSDVYREVLRDGNSFLVCPSVMIRKRVIDELGGFEAKKFRSTSDLGLWLKIMRSYRFGVIEENLINYRVHAAQGTQTLLRDITGISDSTLVPRYYKKTIDHKEFDSLYYQFLFKQMIITAFKRVRAGKKTYVRRLIKLGLSYLMKCSVVNADKNMCVALLLFSVVYFDYLTGLRITKWVR